MQNESRTVGLNCLLKWAMMHRSSNGKKWRSKMTALLHIVKKAFRLNSGSKGEKFMLVSVYCIRGKSTDRGTN